jgi:hypothetical protein
VVAGALVTSRKLGNIKIIHDHVFIQMSNGNEIGKRERSLSPWCRVIRDSSQEQAHNVTGACNNSISLEDADRGSGLDFHFYSVTQCTRLALI